MRLPDVSVYCGMPLSAERRRDKLLGDSEVVFEVLSPSTRSLDLRRKRDECRSLKGIQLIVFFDSDAEQIRLVERTGADAWADASLEQYAMLPLKSFGIALTIDEIFTLD